MHEAAIAESIIEIALTKLKGTTLTGRVGAVEVSIGEFRNVDAESLLFAFDCIKPIFPALENCHLEICLIEANALCRENDHLYRPSLERAFQCPECGGAIGKLISGQELDIVSVTIESTNEDETGRNARVN